MRTSRAAVGSAAFFVVAPGTVVGLVPWLITRWEFREPLPYWVAAQAVGVLLICAGLVPVVIAFAQFARAGGTPMPIAPTQHLVVSGSNRYVRNPMYVGLLAVIIGQALLFGQFSLLLYAAALWAVTASFVRWYEEPTLARQFGAEYEAYRRAVPGWWPRLRPWEPTENHPGTGGRHA
ncbi:MAG: isoprenylcysteine carboxyl methyltransferase [Streptosporangiales bacterium]|nr:isoprenylcysteine carboxyl methyltransferase [Streptosporangiales bacterium]